MAAKNKQKSQQLMDLYHQPTIEVMKIMLMSFPKIKKDRALDVACGIGNVYRNEILFLEGLPPRP